jgi:hypothetical protein
VLRECDRDLGFVESASPHHCHQSIGGRGSKGSVSVSAALASAAIAKWFRLTGPRRLNMNANEMTAIRELTAQEPQ